MDQGEFEWQEVPPPKNYRQKGADRMRRPLWGFGRCVNVMTGDQCSSIPHIGTHAVYKRLVYLAYLLGKQTERRVHLTEALDYAIVVAIEQCPAWDATPAEAGEIDDDPNTNPHNIDGPHYHHRVEECEARRAIDMATYLADVMDSTEGDAS